MKYSFPREIRLTTSAQFKGVFSRVQQKISAETFTIYCCCNNYNHPRLGVIVPKRNIGKSSRRNYFKRIIREHFRLTQYKLKKFDIVIFVNRDTTKLSKELNQSLEKQLSKLTI